MMLAFAMKKDADNIPRPDPRERSAGGNAAEFGDFVEQHFAALYHFAFCMSLAHESAAELTRKVVCEARQAGPDVAVDKCWMLAALHREWLSQGIVRSGNSPSEFTNRLEAPLIATNDAAAVAESTVLRVVHAMPAELRLVISLFYFEQLGYTEIAKIVAQPHTTVIRYLAEAKTQLRRALEEDRTHPEPTASRHVSAAKGGPGE